MSSAHAHCVDVVQSETRCEDVAQALQQRLRRRVVSGRYQNVFVHVAFGNRSLLSLDEVNLTFGFANALEVFGGAACNADLDVALNETNVMSHAER